MNIHSALAQENARQPPLPEVPAQMRAVLNGIPAMVAYWDSELRNRLANDAYRDYFGVTPEQLHGIHIRDLLSATVLEANSPFISKVLDGEPQLFKRTLTDDTGATRFAEVSYMPDVREDGASGDGGVQGFFVMITDITERVLAERRQQQDTDRYRALARSVPGVFVLLFDSELRYLIAEGQELESFGYRSAELEGRNIHEVLDGALANELEPRYRAALAGQEVSWHRRIGPRTYRLKAGPVHSDDGANAGMVVAVDITHRLQQEQTWAALHEIATAVARNAAPADISEQVAFIVRDLFSVDSAAVVRFTGALSAEIVAMAPALPPHPEPRACFFPHRLLCHRPRRGHRQTGPGGLRPGRRSRRRTDAGRRLPVRGCRPGQGPRQPVGRRHPDLEDPHGRQRGNDGTAGAIRGAGGDRHRQHRGPGEPGAAGHHGPAQRTAQPSRP